ncbi:HTH-type transcriptional activator RhaS [Cupriavidus yeoncheonensis]|uniref:HTH-type transcriptional activator RhaS n=1 Tax=Cupriavidus yeoncheonensis TaxID=1462994 RepID=A0A916N262_9BURK|nr:AraC family transcriptional regulator [Cupriavidus yeoncheonensis]CAG2127131.1 HTH-type transcriptional activator RhaS [Cupriavidus yeoncheonensis]
MGGGSDYGSSLKAFELPEAPRLVLKDFQQASMALTEVRSPAQLGLTTAIPYDEAFLVQLRLMACQGVEYFCEGKHLDGMDRSAGIIQFHDLRRDPVAVLTEPFHVMHIRIPLRAMRAVADDMNAPPVDALQLSPSQCVRDPVLRSLFLALRPVLNTPQEVSPLFISHVTLALTAHIAHRYGGLRDRTKPPRGGLAAWQERKAREFLDAAIDGDISLSRLAEECGLSARHFARAFQQSLGVPPHRYLLKRRVDRAKDLLERSPLSLLDIALACGFADQSHFTRVFRASLGVTPGAWRRQRFGGTAASGLEDDQ